MTFKHFNPPFNSFLDNPPRKPTIHQNSWKLLIITLFYLIFMFIVKEVDGKSWTITTVNSYSPPLAILGPFMWYQSRGHHFEKS